MTNHIEEKPTLLIVDDAEINRVVLRKTFISDYKIIEAQNGILAMEKLRNDNIDAVLLDLIMPKMDGYAVLDEMQKDPVLSLIPVIVVTACDNDQSQLKALDHGARDVVSKSYSPKVAKKRVTNILEHSRAIHQAEQSKAMLKIQESELYVGTHDPLTGLLNRNVFVGKIKSMISSKPKNSFVLSYLDIDEF